MPRRAWAIARYLSLYHSFVLSPSLSSEGPEAPDLVMWRHVGVCADAAQLSDTARLEAESVALGKWQSAKNDG